MKKVIRRVVTVITTEIWSVVDAESERGDMGLDAVRVYAAEKRTITEYTIAPGAQHERIEIPIPESKDKNKEGKPW